MSDVTIVAGGWSAGRCDFRRLVGAVIAVNDAAVLLPRWNYAVSMDRLWTESRWERLAALGQEEGREVWLRRSAVQNIPQDIPRAWLRVFECDHETSHFSEFPNQLNGPNSGACALNLAYSLRPSRLFLLGFDMNRDANNRAYWYPPYPWSTSAGGTSSGKYGQWAKQFTNAAVDFAAIGCEVFNVSPSSAIKIFPKITPAQYHAAAP